MYSKSSRIQKSKGGCANAKLEIIQQKKIKVDREGKQNKHEYMAFQPH